MSACKSCRSAPSQLWFCSSEEGACLVFEGETDAEAEQRADRFFQKFPGLAGLLGGEHRLPGAKSLTPPLRRAATRRTSR